MSSNYTLTNLFNVTITLPTQSSPNDGGIDPNTCAYYMYQDSGTTNTTEAGYAKARGNIRFKFLCQQVSFMQNVALTNVIAVGADQNTDPTSLTFTAEVERGIDTLNTPDEENTGVILTGISALIRMIARALIEQRLSIETDVYISTETTLPPGQGSATAADRNPDLITDIDVGPIASSLTAATALITVTQIF